MTTITHEWYINEAARVIRNTRGAFLTEDDTKRLAGFKLTYGTGQQGLLGITFHDMWALPCDCPSHKPAKAKGKRKAKGKAKPAAKPTPAAEPETRALVGICATGQESLVGLCGTVAHELAHAAVGPGHGHGPVWYAAVARVGLLNVHATFTDFTWANFEPELAKALQAIPSPNEGKPLTMLERILKMKAQGLPVPPAYMGPNPPPLPKVRPCSAGVGVRFGTSRGQGSGSRYLKYECAHTKPECETLGLPTSIRCAGTKAQLDCRVCNAPYTLNEASLPPSHGMGQSGQGTPAAEAREQGARPPKAKGTAAQTPIVARPVDGPKPDLREIFGLDRPSSRKATRKGSK